MSESQDLYDASMSHSSFDDDVVIVDDATRDKNNAMIDNNESNNSTVVALREAQEVLDSMRPGHLDHFNLLGVIANPRGTTSLSTNNSNPNSPAKTGAGGSSSGSPPSGLESSSATNANASAAAAAAAPAGSDPSAGSYSYADYMYETYYGLEKTVGQVTEQIDHLNAVFEDWSRQYLEDYYFYTDLNYDNANDVPSSQLPPEELPPQLSGSNQQQYKECLPKEYIHQAYLRDEYMSALEKCISGIGMKKNYFQQKKILAPGPSNNTEQQQQQDASTGSTEEIDVSDIPDIFFQTEFDLTDPATFSQLLLATPEGEGKDKKHAAATSNSQSSSAAATATTPAALPQPDNNNNNNPSLHQSTYELIPIPPQDYFTNYLDKIEVSLLQQVRSKSNAFFQETNRFKSIQQMVHDSLQNVQYIQELHDKQHWQISSWEQIPIWDRQRNALRQLEHVIDNANELIRIRSAIGGLLSAQDDISALEQIHFGRRLLSGESIDHIIWLQQQQEEDQQRQLLQEQEESEKEESDQQKEQKDDTEENTEEPQKDESQSLSQQQSSQEQQQLLSLQEQQQKQEEMYHGLFDIEVGKLLGLRTVGDQLTQYEALVVKNLSEELIELFLEWSHLAYQHGGLVPKLSSQQQEVERRVLQIVNALTTYCPNNNNNNNNDNTNTTTDVTNNSNNTKKMTPSDNNNNKKNAATNNNSATNNVLLEKAIQTYGNRLSDVLRMTVRTTVAEFAADVGSSSKNNKNKNSSNTKNYSNNSNNNNNNSVSVGVSSMSLQRFMDCADMLFEQLLHMITSSAAVVQFCKRHQIIPNDNASNNLTNTSQQNNSSTVALAATNTIMDTIVTSAAELSTKSISELLRLRKEAHSLVTLDEIKKIWDNTMSFITSIEKLCDHKAVALRSMLLTHAKAFIERKHESNMSSLAAALDSERWTQCEVSSERQTVLTRLCSGRITTSLFLSAKTTDTTATSSSSSNSSNKNTNNNNNNSTTDTKNSNTIVTKRPDAEVENVRYKVVWSCLLLVEMVMMNIACAGYFQHNLAPNVIGKVCELLRLFNSRTTQLVLGAGAIKSSARLKSINAKHLSLVTQCLGMMIAILPHIRGGLQAQLQGSSSLSTTSGGQERQHSKQLHLLLNDLDKIKKEFDEHNEKVLNKFVTIIGGIVEHGLAPRIDKNTNFDARSKQQLAEQEKYEDYYDFGRKQSSTTKQQQQHPAPTLSCCMFLEGVLTNTRKMHQVLNSLLPPDHLQDVFSRIFAYIDQKVPILFINAAAVDTTSKKTNNPSGSANTGGKNAAGKSNSFQFPSTENGKRRFLLEVHSMTINLNNLKGVRPWDFTAIHVIEQKIECTLLIHNNNNPVKTAAATATPTPTTDATTTTKKTTDEKGGKEEKRESQPQKVTQDAEAKAAKETSANKVLADDNSDKGTDNVPQDDVPSEGATTEAATSTNENLSDDNKNIHSNVVANGGGALQSSAASGENKEVIENGSTRISQ